MSNYSSIEILMPNFSFNWHLNIYLMFSSNKNANFFKCQICLSSKLNFMFTCIWRLNFFVIES